MLILCLFCVVCVWITDYINTGYVNMGIASRKAYNVMMAETEDEERRLELSSNSGTVSRNRYLGKLGFSSLGLPLKR